MYNLQPLELFLPGATYFVVWGLMQLDSPVLPSKLKVVRSTIDSLPGRQSMSVRNALVLFLALSTLSLLVACGSNGRPPANKVGFGQSSLSGTYVFSTTGVDVNGAFLALAGTLVANGTGGITGGTMDVVGVEVTPSTPIAQAITGTYSVGTDGRGQANIRSSVGQFILDFVLTSTSHGLITEFDGNGTGSGTIDLQTALTGLSQLAGNYAFSFAGVDSTAINPLATAGAFTFDSTGDITAGVEDFNDNGLPATKQPLSDSVAATLGSGTGPGSITLSTALGVLTFDFYPIDATHLKFIETDYTNAFLAGDVFTQAGASIPNGSMVFTMAGGTNNTGPIADGGVMTSDGTGNFSNGLEDINDAGTVSVAQLAFSGTLNAAASGPVGGRVVVGLTGFVPASEWVIYPSSGGLLILETDSVTASGAAYAQTSQTLAATNYGFNLSATNISNVGIGGGAFEEDDIAQFLTTSTTFSGVVDINDTNAGVGTSSQSLSGSFPNTPPVDATGRGMATTTNFANFTFYVVDPSTVLLIETDSNQIGAGIFETQTAPAAQAAARQAISVVHPAVRSHGAIRRATKP